MTDRVERLREQSLAAIPCISTERAELLTAFDGSEPEAPVPLRRARAFRHILQRKAIHIGPGELIVGERGPYPKATPTYPELCCHSIEDLDLLHAREKVRYEVSPEARRVYAETIIPAWRGRAMRDVIFAMMTPEWHACYGAGVFTEFMEQRAPGHTVLDGKIYRRGLLDFRSEIERRIAMLDFERDREAFDRQVQLSAMALTIDAVIAYAHRHAAAARELAAAEPGTERAIELLRIADVCERVPAHAPRDFHEALQSYWFCHLAVITELNTWDSYCPGRLDQHLYPFYRAGLESGALTEDAARELLQCFWVKFNNQPAPPKVGVTAAESGTYTDFCNINSGGLTSDGADGVNDVTYLVLDVIDEMRLLQPSSNVQISAKSPDRFIEAAARIIRKGWGQPSVFNADVVVEELLRQGKAIADARDGGTSGCVEAGAFGKEAYILTGYFNLPKVLEVALHSGVDPRTGRQIGPNTCEVAHIGSFEGLMGVFRRQMEHFIGIKMRGNHAIERLYATRMPAPFLSVLVDDCIARGKDYNAGGARYNTSYIQGVGLGTVTDSLAAIRAYAFADQPAASSPSSLHAVGGEPGRPLPALGRLLQALAANFEGFEEVRGYLLHRCPKYGNDEAAADDVMRMVFEVYHDLVDGKPNTRGGRYHIDLLPTTCHVYFGSVTGATPDGRLAWQPLSEGISPVQGADRKGPTAVVRSAAKMDHVRTGGTLLNLKFSPSALKGADGLRRMADLIRTYFRLGGHHIQFNVVGADVLREAQRDPSRHRDLIVRVAGYSDYFCDLTPALQNEIIARTEHESFHA
jgi:formate C-acetyltransferase